jgi:hypothetical protein
MNNINFFDSIKQNNNIENYNFLYLNTFNKGNLFLCDSVEDFTDIFGDYTSQSYESVKSILSQNISVNVERVCNFPSTPIIDDGYTRSAYESLILPNSSDNVIYNQTLLSTNFNNCQIPVSDFLYLTLVSDNRWNWTSESVIPSDFLIFNNLVQQTVGYTFLSNSTLEYDTKIKFYNFNGYGNYSFDTNLFSLNRIKGLESDKTYKLNFNISTQRLIITQSNLEIYNQILIKYDDIYKLPLQNEIDGYLYSTISFTDYTVEIRSQYLNIDVNSYSIDSKLNSEVQLQNIIFYSNSDDYYFYDSLDSTFNLRLYNQLYNPQIQPIINVFSKTAGLHGNNIFVEIMGKNNANVNEDELQLSVYYYGELVETFKVSDLNNINSNYITLVYVENNSDINFSNLNLGFYLRDGNDGVFDIESYKKSILRHQNKYQIFLCDNYDGIDTIEFINYISEMLPDMIILCVPPININLQYFYNKIAHTDNIFILNGYFIVNGFYIPQYYFILGEIESVILGNYKRLINVGLTLNLIENQYQYYSKVEHINYFESRMLKSEYSTLNSSMGKQIFINSLKQRISNLLENYIFLINIDETVLLEQLQTITYQNVGITFAVIENTNGVIRIKCDLLFNNEVDVIQFDVIKIIR